MKNLDYRAFGTTMKFILAVWLTFVALLLWNKVTADHLVTVTMGGVFGWVLRDAAAKGAEAARDRETV